MISPLSTQDQYKDRIEIIGYGTTILAGGLFLVYFTMLFFSKAVQAQAITGKLLILTLSLMLLILGFFIPLYKNLPRLAYRWLFLFIASFSFFEFFDKGTWYFGLLFIYTLYGYWVLSHPLVIHLYRPLYPRERALQKRSGLYLAHLALLTILALIFLLKGWVGLMHETESNNLTVGLGYLALGFYIISLLWGLRRLRQWARWLLVITSGLIFLVLLPRSLSNQVQNYLEYWKVLLFSSYYLFLTIFMVAAPSVKTLYNPRPKSMPPTS
jgi:hypothetical protein